MQGIDLSKDKLAIQRLREAAEKAKCELSSATQTDINLPFITADASGAKHMSTTISRAKYVAVLFVWPIELACMLCDGLDQNQSQPAPSDIASYIQLRYGVPFLVCRLFCALLSAAPHGWCKGGHACCSMAWAAAWAATGKAMMHSPSGTEVWQMHLCKN